MSKLFKKNVERIDTFQDKQLLEETEHEMTITMTGSSLENAVSNVFQDAQADFRGNQASDHPYGGLGGVLPGGTGSERNRTVYVSFYAKRKEIFYHHGENRSEGEVS